MSILLALAALMGAVQDKDVAAYTATVKIDDV
jgi:hypothetical protein